MGADRRDLRMGRFARHGTAAVLAGVVATACVFHVQLFNGFATVFNDP